MTGEFLAPNWHVALIHYPLALLTVGIVIEVLSFLWRRSGFRAVGRWMILLGALLAIPTATAGMYAFRQVVAPQLGPTEGSWAQVVQLSPWNPEQWRLIRNHVWLEGLAVVLAVGAVVVWIGLSMRGREKLYGVILGALIAALALASAGAWQSGEAIYRYGTAVDLQQPKLPAPVAQAPGHGEGQEEGERSAITYYVPPLELHVVLAGFMAAFAAAAIGLSCYRRTIGVEPAPLSPKAPVRPAVPGGRGPTVEEVAESFAPATGMAGALRVYPGRFWVVAAGVGLLAALAGLWAVAGLTPSAIRDAIKEAFEEGHLRLQWHIYLGVTLVVLALVLAGLVRFLRRARGVAMVLMALWALALAGQIWLGVLMLFDSPEGPLTGFARAEATTMPTTRP